ncbi:MAG: succinate--CoA ligase subunit beta, partial [Phycisphaerales bacterium]|nr:succinate--CoA ligase subunit beta [Phycisphaerales bacterium]
MKIHEYQARALLAKAGVPVPAARVVETAAEAESAFRENETERGGGGGGVKAQGFAGGRGKAGFVKRVKTAEEAHG